MTPIYLDYNATTPVDPAVLAAMVPFLSERFGNPSSTHAHGKVAHAAVANARRQVADFLHARPEEVVFTGGGSEANNLAIKGVVFPLILGAATSRECVVHQLRPGLLTRLRHVLRGTRLGDVHVVSSEIEHPATLQPLAFLQRMGVEVTLLPVDRHGVIDLDALRRALKKPTALVTLMHANNEVGTLQPIAEAATLARAAGALIHVDAAQSAGKVAVDVQAMGVDLLSIAGHKLYAPKGVGALYVRDGVTLEPLIHGAAHESGRRAGTENVPSLVGLGVACELAGRSIPESTNAMQTLRDRLWQALRDRWGDDVVLNGHPTERLPNTLNVSFLGHVGAELLAAAPEIAASTGSACHEGQVAISPVLRAMGVSEAVGRGAVRLSVGRFSTAGEIDRAASLLNGFCK